MIEWLSGSIPDHLSDRQHHRAVHSIGGLFDATRRTTSPSREGRACRVRAIRQVHTERVEIVFEVGARSTRAALGAWRPNGGAFRALRRAAPQRPAPRAARVQRAPGQRTRQARPSRPRAPCEPAGGTDATSASLPARPPIDTLNLKPRSGDLIPISIPGLRRRGRLRRRRRWACGRRRPSPCRCGRANRSPRRRPSPRTASSCRGGGSSADTRTA